MVVLQILINTQNAFVSLAADSLQVRNRKGSDSPQGWGTGPRAHPHLSGEMGVVCATEADVRPRSCTVFTLSARVQVERRWKESSLGQDQFLTGQSYSPPEVCKASPV
jgi:hypothetical protein